MKLYIDNVWSTLWTRSMNSCSQEGTAKPKLALEMDGRRVTEAGANPRNHKEAVDEKRISSSAQENRGSP